MGNFVLDTSTLSGSRFIQRFADTETGGEFRSIEFEISDSINNSDIEIHSIGAAISGGAVSTENE